MQEGSGSHSRVQKLRVHVELMEVQAALAEDLGEGQRGFCKQEGPRTCGAFSSVGLSLWLGMGLCSLLNRSDIHPK